MQQLRQTRGRGEAMRLAVSNTWKKHTKLIAQPSLIRMAFRGCWYHIEGRGRNIITFLTAFWYSIVVILFIIIIAVLVFRLDVDIAKENVTLCRAQLSIMGVHTRVDRTYVADHSSCDAMGVPHI